ncbi:MAG: ParA family protein [bacterium]|nr:ParA family protein [bacterium]
MFYTWKSAAILLGQPEETVKKACGKLNLRRNGLSVKDIEQIRYVLNIPLKFIKGCKQLFLSFKGGTGKTTLSSAYAFRLAELGYKVLAVDLDPQGHLTTCMGLNSEEYEATLYDVLVEKKSIQELIISSSLKNLFVIPSNFNMSPVELSLISLNAREFKLRKALESIQDEYHFIVMDAPPNFGLLNLNSMLAADDIIIPVLADFLSYQSLKLIFEALKDIKDDFNYELKHKHILLNYYNDKFRICRNSREALEKYYPDYLLKSVIRQSTAITRATSKGMTIFQYEPVSKAAEDISALTHEILGRSLG